MRSLSLTFSSLVRVALIYCFLYSSESSCVSVVNVINLFCLNAYLQSDSSLFIPHSLVNVIL